MHQLTSRGWVVSFLGGTFIHYMSKKQTDKQKTFIYYKNKQTLPTHLQYRKIMYEIKTKNFAQRPSVKKKKEKENVPQKGKNFPQPQLSTPP